MKKLLTLTFTILALMLGSTAIVAQPYKKVRHKKQAKKIYNGDYYNNASHNNSYRKGHYNRNGVYVFYKTKHKWHYGRKYRNTYKIKVFPNGRKKVKLINSQRIFNNRYNNGYGVQTYYRSYVIFQNWKRYKVTYKMKRFPNGRIKRKLVKKVRLRYW